MYFYQCPYCDPCKNSYLVERKSKEKKCDHKKIKKCKEENFECKIVLKCQKCKAEFTGTKEFLKNQKRKIKDG